MNIIVNINLNDLLEFAFVLKKSLKLTNKSNIIIRLNTGRA